MTDAQDTGGRVGLVGKTLGRYRISAELGRGGMATVYRAFDPQLARDVAVKVIHGVFTGRGDIEKRFRREAQAVAALKHDGIVAIYDFAPGGDGEPAYIVSELVEGPTLRRLLDDCGGRLMPEIATLIAERVAASLGAAHARGIVHRDVKPDNVMIDLGGAERGPVRVLLTDFGIARMVEDDTMTATGSILGSPSYMSPEQAKGSGIGPPSDVFSLGVMLYQLTTGRPPFGGKDPLSVIAAIVGGEFLRPAQIDAHVSPELEAVILRCLRRAPAERYADGRAACAALHEVAAKSGVGDQAEALRRFFDDRAGLERELGRAVADEAVTRARGCLRRGELSRALAQINRALAYVPGHGGAEALLATISRRRRWVKAAALAAAVAAAVGLGGGIRNAVRARRQAQAAAVAVAAAPVVPAPVATDAPRVAHPTAAPVAPPPELPPPPAVASAPRKRAPGHRRAAAVPAAEATPAAPAETAPAPATPTVAAPPVAQPPAPSPPPPAPAVAPAVGALTLHASYGFCTPSLDDRPPTLRPVYQGIPAGPHRIYCTVPGGARTLVGTYELRAGTHPSLVVVPGADGKPVLARPQ